MITHKFHTHIRKSKPHLVPLRNWLPNKMCGSKLTLPSTTSLGASWSNGKLVDHVYVVEINANATATGKCFGQSDQGGEYGGAAC